MLWVALVLGLAPATPEGPEIPPEGVTPFESDPDNVPPPHQPETGKPKLPDRKTARMVRLNLLLGPVWRTRALDAMVSQGLEYGRMHGFSGTFHATVIVATDREVVQVLDAPIGLGAVARGRLRNRPLYGSIGLSAGILVHRAHTDHDVTHKVDPDFRLPIQLSWTIATVGLTLAVVQGYSVRDRSYVQRGVTVWRRNAYRVGLVLGLHSDIMTRGRKSPRKARRRRGVKKR